jgi:RNA polymerase sigma factor (sigma-70 family)
VRTDARVEDLLHELGPQVLGALAHRYDDFAACEDAVQEALIEAALRWGERGVPESPHGWLLTVASRRMADRLRSDESRRRREDVAARSEQELGRARSEDDTLTLLFLCCHPALSPAGQIALTLRAVGGLTTAEIARAFLLPEPTMAQRISRAKQRIRAAGGSFRMPPESERADRLRAVLPVLYLIFNEGYAASSGPALQRPELTGEAIRLTRLLHRLLPGDGEVAGLLALMLLTDARRPARTGPDGELIPLAEQDRGSWDRHSIDEGIELVTDALARARLGPYQLQAAIAAVHAEARRPEDTDWPQVVRLYELLERVAPNPMVTLNRAVALAMVDGPEAGLALLATLADDPRVAGHYRLEAVRAHLLEMAGDGPGALERYRSAARAATSIPERRYLEARAEALRSGPKRPSGS